MCQLNSVNVPMFRKIFNRQPKHLFTSKLIILQVPSHICSSSNAYQKINLKNLSSENLKILDYFLVLNINDRLKCFNEKMYFVWLVLFKNNSSLKLPNL